MSARANTRLGGEDSPDRGSKGNSGRPSIEPVRDSCSEEGFRDLRGDGRLPSKQQRTSDSSRPSKRAVRRQLPHAGLTPSHLTLRCLQDTQAAPMIEVVVTAGQDFGWRVGRGSALVLGREEQVEENSPFGRAGLCRTMCLPLVELGLMMEVAGRVCSQV